MRTRTSVLFSFAVVFLIIFTSTHAKDPPPGCVATCKPVVVANMLGGTYVIVHERADCLICIGKSGTASGGCNASGGQNGPDNCKDTKSANYMFYYLGGNVECTGENGKLVEGSYTGNLDEPYNIAPTAWFNCNFEA